MDQVGMETLVDQYIQALNQMQEDSGRRFYLPLGELELEAISQLFNFRLQVVKTESLSMIAAASRLHRKIIQEDAAYVKGKIQPALETVSRAAPNRDCVRDALKTILLYVSNCLDNQREEKFRRIRHANTAFQRRVASCPGAVELLICCGFEKKEKEEVMYQLEEISTRLEAIRFALQDFLSMDEASFGVDPRTILPEHIYDRNKEQGGKIVRILNVNTNHYQVHLPRPEPA